ncbi:MAG TPA: hypothetical protein VF677_10450 [Flavobacterium sp.]|jgi:hypothetical protein
MATTNILSTSSIKNELGSALRFAVSDFERNGNTSFLETNLKNNIMTNMNNWAKTVQSNSNNCDPCPQPGSGFMVTVGLQIQLSYKIRVKAGVNVGYGRRSGNFSGSASMHVSAYNSGLGTAHGNKDLVVDVTASANFVIGTGHDIPLQSYSLNYDSPIPLQNDFNMSVGYDGQLLTWNSALNEGKFSFSQIQRQGMIGFRVADVNVSSNNDSRRWYRGGATDKGWTGGITFVTPFMEFGYQNFSGDFLKKGILQEEKRQELVDKIKEIKNSNKDTFSKKFELEKLNEELLNLTRGKFHQQDPYQKSLNMASTYLRINNDGANITFDVIGDAWLQNLIHKQIKDFKFEYKYKSIDVWGGFRF